MNKTMWLMDVLRLPAGAGGGVAPGVGVGTAGDPLLPLVMPWHPASAKIASAVIESSRPINFEHFIRLHLLVLQSSIANEVLCSEMDSAAKLLAQVLSIYCGFNNVPEATKTRGRVEAGWSQVFRGTP